MMKRVQELNDWELKYKAQITYHKCIRAGKKNLATKIMRKYRIQYQVSSDMVMATRIAMIGNAMKNQITPIHYLSTKGLEINAKEAVAKGDLVLCWSKEKGDYYLYKNTEVTIKTPDS